MFSTFKLKICANKLVLREIFWSKAVISWWLVWQLGKRGAGSIQASNKSIGKRRSLEVDQIYIIELNSCRPTFLVTSFPPPPLYPVCKKKFKRVTPNGTWMEGWWYEIRGQIWREQVIDESLLLAAAPVVGNAEQHSVMDHWTCCRLLTITSF